LEKEYPDRLKSRYNLGVIPQETLELFDAVGKFRGCLASGGFIDYDKTAELVVREIRSEKMGPLTFEVPSDYEKDDIPE
jgi:ribosome biogenesis GTPase A